MLKNVSDGTAVLSEIILCIYFMYMEQTLIVYLQKYSTCKVSLHTYAICNSDRGPVTENKD